MGLFDKKICDICGEKIGLLGNRKLDDGNLCKDCAKKLSPWFEERRQKKKFRLFWIIIPRKNCLWKQTKARYIRCYITLLTMR